MKLARILLACTMLLALVFRTLPDSVFDHFHQHEHGFAASDDHTAIGNYKHNCHIEDWHFESFEVQEQHYQTPQTLATLVLPVAPVQLSPYTHIIRSGRAPPVS